MKKIIILVFTSVVLALTSCNDFLDRHPKYGIDSESEVTNEIIVTLTIACYETPQSFNMYNQRIWSLDVIAGNSEVGTGGGTDGLRTVQASNLIAQSGNGFILYLRCSPWVGIGRRNIVLSNLSLASISDEIKTRCMGEAYFPRTHYHYILVCLYGEVPLRLGPLEPGESADIVRNTVDEVYAQILSDCKNAVNILPLKSSYGDAGRGRVCKEAVMAMLADIYLTLAPNHCDYCDEIVTLCNNTAVVGYDLAQCNYADSFNATINNGAESLFEVQYFGSTEYDFRGGDDQSSRLSTLVGPRNSGMVAGVYGWNLPIEEFFKQYEDGDLRKDITVLYQGCPVSDGMEYGRSWPNTGYNVCKLLVSKTVSSEYNANPNNLVVYRYVDILLKKVEALNEQGHPRQAAEPLNIVRKCTGPVELPTTLTQTEMREKIIHERRMELVFEGHRWFDMTRVDNGNYALTPLRSIGKNNVTEERLLLSIPQTEIDSNRLMTQNLGYQSVL